MEENEIQQEVVNNYIKNMEYFEKNHNDVYKKIKLYESAIELSQIKEQYTLEYKDYGFDLLDNLSNSYLYGKNHEQSTSTILNSINSNPNEDSFKTFYSLKYSDELLETEKKSPFYKLDTIISNAPIVHYTNSNLKDKFKLNEIYSYIIFGCGLGFHLERVMNKVNSKIYFIVEPSLEIFRLSLFTTKYYNLSKDAKYIFSVSEEKSSFKKTFNTFFHLSFFYNQYIKFSLFSNSCKIYFDEIQSLFVSQGHFLYSYNRSLKNLRRTTHRINNGYNILNISEKLYLSSFNKPVIILAAGPSLQKNIEFLQKNRDKYIIVSIFVIIPYLEKNGIVPDIVTHFDEQDEERTTKKIKNSDFFKKTIFLFSTGINEKLLTFFKKENIFLFQTMFEVKKGFGELTSPSIGEITYALMLIFGSKIINLIGIDFALSSDDKTHIDDHCSGLANHIEKESDVSSFKFKRNVLQTKGNFREIVDTLEVYRLSIEHMNHFTDMFMDNNFTKVYNLSDGAYLNNTIPLHSNKIVNNKIKLDKALLYEELHKEFLSCSSNEINKLEEKFINKKIVQANLYLDIFKNMKLRKFKTSSEFKSVYFQVIDEVIYNPSVCTNLQKVLLNYFKYNMPHVFTFFHSKDISNPKKHITYLNKTFCTQIENIIKEYIDFYDKK